MNESMRGLLREVWVLSWLWPGAPQLPRSCLGLPPAPHLTEWQEPQGGARRELGSHRPNAWTLFASDLPRPDVPDLSHPIALLQRKGDPVPCPLPTTAQGPDVQVPKGTDSGVQLTGLLLDAGPFAGRTVKHEKAEPSCEAPPASSDLCRSQERPDSLRTPGPARYLHFLEPER